MLKIGFLNIHGMKGKEIVLNDFLLDNNNDLVCLSEYWVSEIEFPYLKVQDFKLAKLFASPTF